MVIHEIRVQAYGALLEERDARDALDGLKVELGKGLAGLLLALALLRLCGANGKR